MTLNASPLNSWPTREEVMKVLDHEEFRSKLQESLSGLAEEPTLHEYCSKLAIDLIEGFKRAIRDVTNDHDVHYMVAVKYASLKATWILLNTHMQYTFSTGGPSMQDMYTACINSLILEALEPLVHPIALEEISRVLTTPVAETLASSGTGLRGSNVDFHWHD